MRGESSNSDDFVKRYFERPEIEKMMLEISYFAKLKVMGRRLPTLRDIEVFYPRLKEKIVFSSWLRQQAVRYIRRKQQNPFIVRCPTCKQEVDRFDFVQIQGGLMKCFFNITNDGL
jgi:predicted DNA-binding ribbon-helix-helix protein